MPADVLVVEDNPEDLTFIASAFRYVDPSIAIAACENGAEAMQQLRRDPRIRLIIMDWSMPDMDGRALLKLLKSNEQLRRIPAVVLSTSGEAADIACAYRGHANAYLVKPDTIDGYRRIARRLKEFWLELVCDPAAA